MDFKNYLETNAQKVNQELELILAEFLNEAKKTNIKLLPLALSFINSCKGGKRIRGVLVKLGYEIGSQSSVVSRQSSESDRISLIAASEAILKTESSIIKIAAAIEILHTALLIHDDVIDQSPTRRGSPSLYQALGGDHYGISQAISLGDIGLYLPVKIITESNFLGEYKIKALTYLSQTIVNTGWGQILDVELPRLGNKVAKEDRMLLNKLKTACYTISGPLIMGAILSGAEEKLVRELEVFGENLGIAYQIQDDILDGESNAANTEFAQALEYVSLAKKMIPKITSDSGMRKLLEEMTEYLVERSK